jgi:tRNA threonylcarbamoyl adenosine modification protein YeaZ
VLDAAHEVVVRGHAERLLPMIESVLAGRRPGAILVDCGPGSFTGVRVGLAAARGLAIGWGVPVSGYSSMALIAAASGASACAVALTGGHGELFVQDYGGDPIAPLGGLRSLPPGAAAAAIPAPLVFGSGARTLVETRGHGEWLDALPRAADAWALPPALRSLPPRPIYGRGPDARPMT